MKVLVFCENSDVVGKRFALWGTLPQRFGTKRRVPQSLPGRRALVAPGARGTWWIRPALF